MVSAVSSFDALSISSTGNAADFGNLTVARRRHSGFGNSVRGLCAGGRVDPNMKNEIDFVTVASTGNAIDFGDLTQGKSKCGGCNNNVIANFVGGYVSDNINDMDFVTIASTGNAADFGDAAQAGEYYYATSDSHGGLVN